MITKKQKQVVIPVIKNVVQAIREKNYEAIPNLVHHSDLPITELQEVIEHQMQQTGQTRILPFSEDRANFYEDEDGEGFEVEYLLQAQMMLLFEAVSIEGTLYVNLEEWMPV